MSKVRNTFVFLVSIITVAVAVAKFWKEIMVILKKVKQEYEKRVDESSPLSPHNIDIQIQKAKKQVVRAAKKEAKVVEKRVKAEVKAVGAKAAKALSDRQAEIWDLVKKISNKKFTLAEIAAKFPTVTTRTLRRDMEVFEKKKILKQRGSTKNVYYEVV